MTTLFPSQLDTFTNPTATDKVSDISHADQHANANDAIEALQEKVGIDNDTNIDSHDYKLSGITDGDTAVSKTERDTLANSINNNTSNIADLESNTVKTTGDQTITGSLTVNGVRLPSTDGVADQLIKTDGAGNLSFTSITGGEAVLSYTPATDIPANSLVGSSLTGEAIDVSKAITKVNHLDSFGTPMALQKINTSKFVFIYRSSANIYGFVFEIDVNDNITVGEHKQIFAGAGSNPQVSIESLDDDKFTLAAFETGSDDAVFVSCTASGLNFSIGSTVTEVNFNTSSGNARIVKIGLNKFLYVVRNALIVGTVSGNTITLGTKFNGSIYSDIKSAGDDRAIGAVGQQLRLITISGTAITEGTLEPAVGFTIFRVLRFSDTEFLIAATDEATLVSLTGSTFTYGTTFTDTDLNLANFALKIDDFILYGNNIVLEYTGLNITGMRSVAIDSMGSGLVLSTDFSLYDTNKIVTVGQDNPDDFYIISNSNISTGIIGVTKDSLTKGVTGDVLVRGIGTVDNISLTPGKIYVFKEGSLSEVIASNRDNEALREFIAIRTNQLIF